MREENKIKSMLLNEGIIISSDNSLHKGTPSYVLWNSGSKEVHLDGSFASEELEAIMWWMEHKG